MQPSIPALRAMQRDYRPVQALVARLQQCLTVLPTRPSTLMRSLTALAGDCALDEQGRRERRVVTIEAADNLHAER